MLADSLCKIKGTCCSTIEQHVPLSLYLASFLKWELMCRLRLVLIDAAIPDFSADWSIELLLQKWNLVCTNIPLSSFGADGEDIAGAELINNHTIQLLVITHSRT